MLEKMSPNLTEHVIEYQSYSMYKAQYRIVKTERPLHEMETEEVQKILRTALRVHDNQYSNAQNLKASELKSLNIVQRANEVLMAHRFYKAYIADPQSPETKALAKEIGYSEQKYKFIFARLGLYYNRTGHFTKVEGQRTRAYSTTIRPFFDRT